MKDFKKIYKLIEEIDSESIEGLHDIMCVVSNVILARELMAITEDLELHVKTTYKNGGRQIEASVGKAIEIDESELDEEMKENLKKMMLATEVAKA